MTVHFIGAGPGAPDLITVRGLKLIESCPVCLYAGSLVPREVVAAAPENARVLDTAKMNLDEIVAEMKAAHDRGQDVARVHTGDPSLFGAIDEQMRRLDALGIDYDVTPGVPAYCGAAAALKRQFTLPTISQTIVLTRTNVRTSPMPEGQDLATIGRTKATLAIHLSAANMKQIVDELSPIYGADCPCVVAYRVTWPDERIIRGTLADIEAKVAASGIKMTALVLVGHALAEHVEYPDSFLYDRNFTTGTREAKPE
ncbi:Precorrin-4 C(11)-methyltransferase [uncultured Alphaproteobacteria bacterium]|uniref:Precorrin-4 C(11)-methyltransferase n=1 Tax=uncultured Alphaproteobacteria bacterium TaxID=91750 RepID=A0A212K8H4_9PROT|nr:Precorrin-4 C(11)-methyltransferase [uncultured Alphaproteobacteria bacterium]